MQIESRYGDFTVTCADTNGVLDPDRVVVRACSVHELAQLREAYPKLGWIEVEREGELCASMTLPKHIWSHIVEDMVLDIDYAAFVPEETHRIPLSFAQLRSEAA